MDFVARVLSGSGRLKDRAKDVDELNRVFKANQDSVKKIVEKDGSELHALLDMIYDSSFPEEKVFMKNPSRELLKFKKELVLRLLSGMDSQGVPVTGMMLSLVRKHGIETISDTLISFLKLLTPVLESKEAPDFTTDDVLDAIDMEWHTSSNTASPLLNVFASMTNSPRRSAASASESPLSNSLPNYRRAFSDRATLDGPSRHESLAKSTFDKAEPRLSKSISAQHAARKDLALSETSETIPYKLNLDSSEEFGSRKHRRKSSSLRDLLAEDTDVKDSEAAVGVSKRRSTPRGSLDFNVTSSPSAFTSVLPRRSQQFSRDGSQQLQHDRDNDKTGKNSPFLESSRSIVWGQDDGAFTVDFLDDSFELQKGSPSLVSTGGELPENIGFKSDRNLDTDAITTPLVISVRDGRSESDIEGSKSDGILDTDAIATAPAEEADERSSIQARTEDNRMPETASSTIFPSQSSTSDSISQSESVREDIVSSGAKTSREIIEFCEDSEEFPAPTSEPNNVSTEQCFLPSTRGAESPPQETAESGDLPTSTEINSDDNTTCQEDQAEDLILPATAVLPSGAESDMAAPPSMVDSSEQGVTTVPSHTSSTNCENAIEIGGQMSLNQDYQKPSISIGEPGADDVILHMDYPEKVANLSDNGPGTDQSFMEKFQSAESADIDGRSTNLNATAFFEKEGGSAELKDVEEVTGFQEFGLVTTTQNRAYEFEESKAAETPVCEVETDSASRSAGGSSITDAPTARSGSDVEDGSHDNSTFNAIKEDTYTEVLQAGVPLGDMHRNNREELKDTTDETLGVFPEVAKSQKFEPLCHTDNDAVKLLVASILGDILGEFPEVDHVSLGEKIQLHRLEPQVLMGDESWQVTEVVNDGSIDAPSDEPVPTVSFACPRETEHLPNLLDSDVKLSLPNSEKPMNLVTDNAESSHDPSIANNTLNNRETVLVMDNEELSHDPSNTNNTDDNCVICSPSVEDSSSGECPPFVVDVSQEDAVKPECVGDVMSERNSDTDAQSVDIEMLDNEDLEGEHAAHVDGDHGSDNNGGANALLENATWEAEEGNPSTKEDALAKLVKDEIATGEEDAFTLEERNAEAIDDVGIDDVQDSASLTDEGLKDDVSIQSSETIGDVGIDNYVQDSEALIEEDPKDDVSIQSSETIGDVGIDNYVQDSEALIEEDPKEDGSMETSESLLKTNQLEGGPKDDGCIESSENLLLTNVEEGRKDDVSMESSEDLVSTECAGQLQPSVSDVQMVGLPVMDIPAARAVDDLVLKVGEEEANGLSGRNDEPSLADTIHKSEPSLEDTHKSDSKHFGEEVDSVVWPDARTVEGEVVKGNCVAALEELLKQERNGTRSERGSWLENAAQENPCTTETMNMDASGTRADQEHEFLKPSLLDTNSQQGSLPSENVKEMDSSTPQSVPTTVATKEDESDAAMMEFSNAVSGPSVEPKSTDLDSALWAEDPPDEIPKPQTKRFLGKLRQRFCCGRPSTH